MDTSQKIAPIQMDKKTAVRILTAKIDTIQKTFEGLDGADIFSILRMAFTGQENLLEQLCKALGKSIKAEKIDGA